MVVPGAGIAEQGIRDIDGKVFAYFVPAEEMDRLRAEIDSLREQVVTLQRQKDRYLREVEDLLKTRFPLLPTPEEMADPSRWATSDDIRQIIADLESR
jgi:hypothetical protein